MQYLFVFAVYQDNTKFTKIIGKFTRYLMSCLMWVWTEFAPQREPSLLVLLMRSIKRPLWSIYLFASPSYHNCYSPPWDTKQPVKGILIDIAVNAKFSNSLRKPLSSHAEKTIKKNHTQTRNREMHLASPSYQIDKNAFDQQPRRVIYTRQCQQKCNRSNGWSVIEPSDLTTSRAKTVGKQTETTRVETKTHGSSWRENDARDFPLGLVSRDGWSLGCIYTERVLFANSVCEQCALDVNESLEEAVPQAWSYYWSMILGIGDKL